MRSAAILSLALSAVPLLLGCGPDTSSTPAHSSPTSTSTEKIGEAAEATTEAAKVKRDEFAREASKGLAELNVKYEELKVRAAQAEGQAKEDLQQTLEKAGVKRDAAARRLDELKEAGADRWEKLKEGVRNAVDDLKTVFD